MTAVLRDARLQRAATTAVFLILFAIYGLWLGDTFLDVDARLLDFHQNVPILLLGFAVVITLICGEFDLSVASMATLTAFLAVGLATKEDWPFALVVVACLAVGAIGGVLNALLVLYFRVHSFIATLGVGGIFLGLSAVYSGGSAVTQRSGGPQLPDWFTGSGSLGSYGTKFPSWLVWIGIAVGFYGLFRSLHARRPGRFSEAAWTGASVAITVVVAAVLVVALDLPGWVDRVSWMIALLLAVALVLWAMLRYTTFGRYLKATGSNAPAAKLAGVRTGRQTFAAFVIGGVLAASAGILLAANLGSANPDMAVPYLLPAFTAAFLSTVIFSLGKFTIWGTVVGGVFLVWVGQGLILGGLEFTWVPVVNGTVLVSAVALSTMLRRTD